MIATLLFALLLQGVSAEVVEIVDGDTLKVRLSGEVVSVRLIGVDAPEGAPAEHLEFLLGETIRLEPEPGETELHKGMFGRLLAYVFVGEKLLNAELVRQGHARVLTRYPFGRMEEFQLLERGAKAQGVGVWAEAKPVGAYVASRNSSVYHRASCSYVRRILPENLITFDSEAAAKGSGRRGCSRCIGTTITTPTSSRCAATTQKGTRCKRKAAAGSSYCWQHK